MEGNGEVLLAGLIHKKSLKEEGGGGASGRGQRMKGWGIVPGNLRWGLGMRNAELVKQSGLNSFPTAFTSKDPLVHTTTPSS